MQNLGGTTLSVVMTTCNGAAYVNEQVESIFAQNRLPDEIVVCDDCSTDGTADILRDLAERSPCPMKLVFNTQRLGSTKNFEQAITLSSGDIIALSDQDDIWLPHKLAVIETAFAADPELGAVLSNAELIDAHGLRLSGDLWSRARFTRARQNALRDYRRDALLLGLPFSTGATMAFRGRFNHLLLPFPAEAPSFIHDRWIAVLIAAVGKLDIISDKLIGYRLHEQQQLGVGKVPLVLRIFKPHPCRSDALALAALQERLAGSPSFQARSDFHNALSERQRHVAARLHFSRNPFRRATQVASEVITGRYNLFPYGLAIAVQDMIAGTD